MKGFFPASQTLHTAGNESHTEFALKCYYEDEMITKNNELKETLLAM